MDYATRKRIREQRRQRRRSATLPSKIEARLLAGLADRTFLARLAAFLGYEVLERDELPIMAREECFSYCPRRRAEAWYEARRDNLSDVTLTATEAELLHRPERDY